MAHFQVPNTQVFGAVKYPLGNWPNSPAGFRLFISGTGGVEKIGIENGQTLTLQLTSGRGCRIETEEMYNARNGNRSSIPHKISVSPDTATADIQLFTIKGIANGAALLSARDSADRSVAELFVAVGKFENHADMEKDLIAEVMKGNDSLRIHALQRMLNNNEDNIFNQKAPSNINTSTGSDMTCGMVANDRGLQIFQKSTLVTHDWYLGAIHEPLSQKVKKDRSNLRYSSKKVAALAQKVGATLRKGEAVRLAVVDSPEIMQPRNGKLVAYDAGGHTVLVVGCNKANTEFLYIDPWFNGSKMEYKGGFNLNRFATTCEQIGLFVVEYEKSRAIDPKDTKPNIIRQKSTTYGTFKPANSNTLEVVAGPFAGI